MSDKKIKKIALTHPEIAEVLQEMSARIDSLEKAPISDEQIKRIKVATDSRYDPD